MLTLQTKITLKITFQVDGLHNSTFKGKTDGPNYV
jgi:hypothetical protein